MPNRIVRLEENLWRIRPDEGELAPDEQKELQAYFVKFGCPTNLSAEGYAYPAASRGRRSARHSSIFTMAEPTCFRSDQLGDSNQRLEPTDKEGGTLVGSKIFGLRSHRNSVFLGFLHFMTMNTVRRLWCPIGFYERIVRGG
jgi:hypothetical protein